MWMRIALFFNLAGTVLLFLSFQATSSNLIIKRASNGSTAMCIDQTGIAVTNPQGAWELGGACPDWPQARPTAVVNVERPYLITIGFILASLGFLLQVLATPSAKTISQIRADLKAATMRQKFEQQQAKIRRLPK
jgi:hypothetical protein